MTCPVCKRKIDLKIETVCPRCKADLTLLCNLDAVSEKNILEGKKMFLNRKFDDAISSFQKAIYINDSKEAIRGKAISFFSKKDFRAALKSYLTLNLKK